MDRTRKRVSLLLILMIAIPSLLIVGNAYAQTIPKPSVPQFTVKFVDSSYDVPTTTSIDQYTGQTITHQGYHVENKTIQLTIKNQPFNSYIDNGQNISLYFNVREKGHFTENWTTLYNPDRGFLTQSEFGSTVVSYSLTQNEFPFWNNVNSDAKIDFQVQALIGSVHRVSNITANTPIWEMFPWVFDGQTSEWSDTQTITIPASSSYVSPTPTPSIPEFSWLLILPLFFSIFAIAVIIKLVKIEKYGFYA